MTPPEAVFVIESSACKEQPIVQIPVVHQSDVRRQSDGIFVVILASATPKNIKTYVQSGLVSDRILLVIRPKKPKMTLFNRVPLDTHYR